MENLILNILGKDEQEETPAGIVNCYAATIKKLNKELVELRHKNVRLEREIKDIAMENAHLKRLQPSGPSEELSRDMVELVLEMFDFIVVLKNVESAPSSIGLLDNLFQKSDELIRKLNPLVVRCDLEGELRERGLKVHQELHRKSMADKAPSQPHLNSTDRYPLSCLMKTLNVNS